MCPPDAQGLRQWPHVSSEALLLKHLLATLPHKIPVGDNANRRPGLTVKVARTLSCYAFDNYGNSVTKGKIDSCLISAHLLKRSTATRLPPVSNKSTVTVTRCGGTKGMAPWPRLQRHGCGHPS